MVHVGEPQIAQGLAQAPRVDGSGFIVLKKLRPACGVGWVTDRDRRQDGDPDGIRYLVALPQAPVLAADRKRDDGPDEQTKQDAKPSGNEQANGQRRSRGVRARAAGSAPAREGPACWGN